MRQGGVSIDTEIDCAASLNKVEIINRLLWVESFCEEYVYLANIISKSYGPFLNSRRFCSLAFTFCSATRKYEDEKRTEQTANEDFVHTYKQP